MRMQRSEVGTSGITLDKTDETTTGEGVLREIGSLSQVTVPAVDLKLPGA